MDHEGGATRPSGIRIGNAPCSWGVEFAQDSRNPPWERVLSECAQAGYGGIELGPVGYMPEDPSVLGDALAANRLELIGGVVFRPFHDPAAWDEVADAALRTCRALAAHGARHYVLIDSISPRRAATAGRPSEAAQMDADEWRGFAERIAEACRMGLDHGLVPELHPHAGGFMDFEPEIERILAQTDPDAMKLCVDTGHCAYAGFDPVDFMRRHMGRVSYVHLKSTCARTRERVVANRTGFYEACGEGIFCNLADGEVDLRAVRDLLAESGYGGWCTVEQDCDPNLDPDPLGDARRNREHLESIGL